MSDVIEHHLPTSSFALAFSSSQASSSSGLPQDLKLAVGSFETRGENNVTILRPSNDSFEPIASALHAYPATQVGFAPQALKQKLSAGHDLLATTSDALRLWDFNEQDPRLATLAPRCVLTNVRCFLALCLFQLNVCVIAS